MKFHRLLCFFLFSAAALAATPCRAQGIKTVAVRAARMVDPQKGMVPDAVVIIEGERVAAAGSRLTIPTGAAVIDLGDATLLPGLIDCHSHLMARIPDSPSGYLTNLAAKSQAFRALEGAANARAVLRSGFTTVRDVESEGAGFADVALRDAIHQGLVEGPRMLVATRGIAAVGTYFPFRPSPDLREFPAGAQMVSGVEEVRRAVREQIGGGADHIKLYADWETPTLTVEELRVAVEEAHKAKRRVAAHANTPAGIRNALAAGVDSIEHGHNADAQALDALKKSGATLVPTVGVVEAAARHEASPRARELMEGRAKKARALVAQARALGIPIALGWDASNAEDQGHAALELQALAQAGLSPLEAIRAATGDAARLLGLQGQVGALEKGSYADLIAVRGDPLRDLALLERVQFVMKGGQIVRDELRH